MARQARFLVYEDHRGEWRWRLRSSNGRTIADSGQGYDTRPKALDAATRTRIAAVDAILPPGEA